MVIFFLEADDITTVVQEYHSPYWSSFSSLNSTLRTFTDFSSWIQHVLSWKKNKEVLKTILRNHIQALPYPYPSLSWKLVLVGNALENGMPHTIHDLIILPLHCLHSSTLSETLVHEQIHVLQKKNPRPFQSLYRDIWKWTPISISFLTQYVPRSILDNHRANPDTPHWWMFIHQSSTCWIPTAQFIPHATSLLDVMYYYIILSFPDYQYQTMVPMKSKQGCYHVEEAVAVFLSQRIYKWDATMYSKL